MQINNSTFSVDISTDIIVNKNNLGYSDFDIRMSSKELITEIGNLEFTFGKAVLNNGFLVFTGARKNQSAHLFMNKNDLNYIYSIYKRNV
jgi:hypothetical protein